MNIVCQIQDKSKTHPRQSPKIKTQEFFLQKKKLYFQRKFDIFFGDKKTFFLKEISFLTKFFFKIIFFEKKFFWKKIFWIKKIFFENKFLSEKIFCWEQIFEKNNCQKKNILSFKKNSQKKIFFEKICWKKN